MVRISLSCIIFVWELLTNSYGIFFKESYKYAEVVKAMLRLGSNFTWRLLDIVSFLFFILTFYGPNPVLVAMFPHRIVELLCNVQRTGKSIGPYGGTSHKNS